MRDLLEILIALLSTVLFGLFVPIVLQRATAKTKPKSDNKQLQALIESILSESRVGSWIGTFERFLILAGFWQNEPSIIVGWFAFKIATKWQVWRDIVQIPSKLDKIPEIEWFKVRHDFGGYFSTRFLVGTLMNVLIALVSAYIGHNILEICGAR